MTGFKDENGHRIEPQPPRCSCGALLKDDVHLAQLNQRRENIARLLSENTKLREDNQQLVKDSDLLFKNWFKVVTER